MDKETIAHILAYVEKNCTEVEEVEEYLWTLLDESEKQSVQNQDIESILQKLLNEGYSDDKLLIEFNKRVNEYNKFINDKILEFKKDMEDND